MCLAAEKHKFLFLPLMMKSFLLLSFLVIYSHLALAQSLWNSVFHNTETQWVDSIFSTLSEEERIAQLFMVAAYSNKDEKHKDEIVLNDVENAVQCEKDAACGRLAEH